MWSLCVFVYICVCMPTCTCVWNPEVDVWCFPWLLSTFIFWQGFSLGAHPLTKWRVRELWRPVGSGSSHCDHAYILVWDLVIPTHIPMLVLQPLFQQSHLPSSSHKHCVSLVYDPFVIFPWEIWLSDFDCHCLALTEEQETHFLTKWCSDLNNFQPVSKSYFLKVEIIII